MTSEQIAECHEYRDAAVAAGDPPTIKCPCGDLECRTNKSARKALPCPHCGTYCYDDCRQAVSA